jgi:hypothetical protein
MSTVSALLTAARTQLLTVSGTVASEETIFTIQSAGRSPRHQEIAVGRRTEAPLPGPQRVAVGMPVRVPLEVVTAYQLRPKDRQSSLSDAEAFAADLRAAMLASGWLGAVGAVVTFTGSAVDAGPDGWLWFTLSFAAILTVDIS